MSLFDVVDDGARILIQNLEDDLTVTLLSIIGDNRCNLGYMRERLNFLEKTYDARLEESRHGVNALGIPAWFVLEAYAAFEGLVKGYRDRSYFTPYEERLSFEECTNIHGEWLNVPDPNDLDLESRRELLESWDNYAEMQMAS